MENKELIICEKCYEENEITRNTCKYCGAKLYKNDNNKSSNSKNKIKDEETINYDDENEITNKVASKFSLLVGIMKFIGYSASFISFIALLSSEETGFAFLCLIGGAIFTWLSTLFFEAVAEGLQLLQDIKDKI